jgi:hypothetical protein
MTHMDTVLRLLCPQDLDSDALRRELFKDHMGALKRRCAEDEKRQKEVAVAAFKALLERSNLKASSSWRKVQGRLQDEEEYEVGDGRHVCKFFLGLGAWWVLAGRGGSAQLSTMATNYCQACPVVGDGL